MKNLIILGSSGFAREVLWLLREINAGLPDSPHTAFTQYKVLGFISDDPGKSWSGDIGGLPLLGNDQWAFDHLDRSTVFVVGIGNPAIRQKVAQRYLDQGFKAESLVHPSARLGYSTQLGQGCLICAGAVLTTDIRLGSFGIVNLNATVGHDCRLEDFVTIGPGSNLSGGVSIGTGSELGCGVNVIPACQIGAQSQIGAGAVVVGDLPGGQTYAGVPARAL